MHVFLKLHVIK